MVCEPEEFANVRDSLVEQGIELDLSASGLEFMSLADVDVGEEDLAVNDAIVDRLLDCDDVDAVASNFSAGTA